MAKKTPFRAALIQGKVSDVEALRDVGAAFEWRVERRALVEASRAAVCDLMPQIFQDEPDLAVRFEIPATIVFTTRFLPFGGLLIRKLGG